MSKGRNKTKARRSTRWTDGIAILAGAAVLLGCFAVIRARTQNDGRALAASQRFRRQFEADRFHKGNTHAHSNPGSLDADSSSQDVVDWYRGKGYQFVVMTDHSDSGESSEAVSPSADFAAVPGEEITFGVTTGTEVHVSALCSTQSAGRHLYTSTGKALLRALEHVSRQSGAVAQINHPNYKRALDLDLILQAADSGLGKRRPYLLEIANQHPQAVNAGEPLYGRLSTEELWDELLAKGRKVYGVASDDAHHLKRFRKQVGFDPLVPGLGWIQVEAQGTELTASSLCDALEKGKFYASTGVELDWIRARGDSFELKVVPRKGAAAKNHVTYFIGADAQGVRILDEQRGLSPRYVLKGGERYVRARVCGPGEERKYPNRSVRMRETCAWTQPQFVTQP